MGDSYRRHYLVIAIAILLSLGNCFTEKATLPLGTYRTISIHPAINSMGLTRSTEVETTSRQYTDVQMGDLIQHCCLTIVVTILSSVGNCSRENRLRFERHPEGVDFDENYRIKVTRGQEVISSTLTQAGHYRAITVTVSAFNAIFVLDLHLNTYLFAVGFVERSFSKDGLVYHDVNHTESHCYYLGKVRDQPQSTAAVSTCKGIVGYFTIGNVSYHIEPSSNQLHGTHTVYRSREDTETIYRCGHDKVSLHSLLNPAQHNERLKRFIWPQDLDDKNKVVELYVANDYSQFVAKGSNENAVFQRTKDIVNIASAGYQPLGIYIVLVGVEVWNTGDKITIDPSDENSTLSEWAAYRMTYVNPIHYNDNGILITNNTFGEIVGLAYIGTMCQHRNSAAFVGDVYPLASVAGSIMAHEMGHSFGLIHDPEMGAPCPCSEPNGTTCIMYPTLKSVALDLIYSSRHVFSSDLTFKEIPVNPPFTWSQCSKDQFAVSFQHGLDICLYNVPQTIQPSNGVCGNGIVENGEQCDCGNSTNQECNSACCNSSTCQLVSPATCAYGRCCDINNCQILSSGTLCRQKSDDCDLSEFCNGKEPRCPQNTFKPDGTKCTVNGDYAYCYDGQCRSHSTQCQLLWGQGTEVSNSICYHQLNDKSAQYGNCGFKWLPSFTYIPCKKSDVMCGKLLCDNKGKNLSNYIGLNNYYLSNSSIGGYICNSISFDFGLKTQDPGLVPNGAKCGDGKMCVSQKCVSIDSLQAKKCSKQCGYNEECNNEGFCQNLIGPSYQSEGGTASAGLKIAMCILFLVVIPLLVIGGMFAYEYRHRIEESLCRVVPARQGSYGNRSQPTVPTVSQSANNEVFSSNHLQPNSTRLQPSRSAPHPPLPANKTQLPATPKAPPAVPYGYDNHGAVLSAVDLTPAEQNNRYFALQQTRQLPPVSTDRAGPSGRPMTLAKPTRLGQVL